MRLSLLCQSSDEAEAIPLVATAALLASLSSAVASPNPNYEISKTSVNVDKHREKLDNGEIIVRVQR